MTDRTGSPGSHEIGYGRPPKHTRFKKGRSGNPKGRPKEARNLKTDLMEELGERILVREGARAHRISKQRAMVKTLMAGTLKGDARLARLLLSMMMRLLEGEVAGAAEEALDADDLEILEDFARRGRASRKEGPAADEMPQADPSTGGENP